MSISNEILMIVTATSLGFTVATGINLTYFNNISIKTETNNNNEIKNIPIFWKNYDNIKGIGNNPNSISSNNFICVLIDDKKICIQRPE